MTNGRSMTAEEQQAAVEAAYRARSLEFLKNSDNWPLWPVVPVKRYRPEGGMPEVGYCVAEMGHGAAEPIVYLGNVHGTLAGQLADLPQTPYPSLEAIIADGWIVD